MQDNNNIPETIPNKATVHINMDLKEGMFVPGLSPAAPFTPGFTFTHQDFPLKLYSRKETAKILGFSSPTILAMWAFRKKPNLPFIRIGKSIRYLESDILQFIEDNRVTQEALEQVSLEEEK